MIQVILRFKVLLLGPFTETGLLTDVNSSQQPGTQEPYSPVSQNAIYTNNGRFAFPQSQGHSTLTGLPQTSQQASASLFHPFSPEAAALSSAYPTHISAWPASYQDGSSYGLNIEDNVYTSGYLPSNPSGYIMPAPRNTLQPSLASQASSSQRYTSSGNSTQGYHPPSFSGMSQLEFASYAISAHPPSMSFDGQGAWRWQPEFAQQHTNLELSPPPTHAPPATYFSPDLVPSSVAPKREALRPRAPGVTAGSSYNMPEGSPSQATPSNAAKSSESSGSGIARKAYHPSPSANRSQWVMWMGNVPSDATYEELSDFLTASGQSGVVSVFLMNRSRCAFVNYDQEENLTNAIATLDGSQLRPKNPQCPRLVCRNRNENDELKSGVGGQRGRGVHKQYAKQLREKEENHDLINEYVPAEGVTEDEVPSKLKERVPSVSSSVSARDGASDGSASFASGSTNSSLLTRSFPQRYFILKSLSQDDLDNSVRTGLWSTQEHNEIILDQAFRTSKEVFLIFSVNKSGEFYGYAKMTGPIYKGKLKDIMGKRMTSPAKSKSFAHHSPETGLPSVQKDTIEEEEIPQKNSGDYFPNQAVEESPSGMTADEQESEPKYWYDSPSNHHARSASVSRSGSDLPAIFENDFAGRASSMSPSNAPPSQFPKTVFTQISAPAELHQRHRKLTLPTPTSLDVPRNVSASEAITKHDQRHSIAAPTPDTRDNSLELESDAPLLAMKHPSVEMEGEVNQARSAQENKRGEAFQLEWICMDRLPFTKTRNLRNSWNREREVKVSRDGTELEPALGQELLAKWAK